MGFFSRNSSYKETISTTNAMKAMRIVRDLLQVKGCPTEVLQGLAQVERQLLHYKLEAKQAKQVTIEHFLKGETRSKTPKRQRPPMPSGLTPKRFLGR